MEELCVFLKLLEDEQLVDFDQIQWLGLFKVDEIDVLEGLSAAACLADLYLSVHGASFDVVDSADALHMRNLERVGQHHQVDFALALHLDGEDAIDAGDVTGGIFVEIFEIGLAEALEEELALGRCHRLDHEGLVMAEEEEAAAGAACLPSLEDVAAVLVNSE